MECLKGIWTTEKLTYKGDFYQFHNYPISHSSLKLPNRPHPLIFQGGNFLNVRENGANVCDYHFVNGNTLKGFQDQIADVKESARNASPEAQDRFAVNGFAIIKETKEETTQFLCEIQGRADKEVVEAFGSAVKHAGASTAEKKGMRADSKFGDLVRYNDGFKTKLIGTKE